MDVLLQTHLIDAGCLRNNDFETFFKARADALLSLIERATGNQIARTPGQDVIRAGMEADDDVEELDLETILNS